MTLKTAVSFYIQEVPTHMMNNKRHQQFENLFKNEVLLQTIPLQGWGIQGQAEYSSGQP